MTYSEQIEALLGALQELLDSGKARDLAMVTPTSEDVKLSRLHRHCAAIYKAERLIEDFTGEEYNFVDKG